MSLDYNGIAHDLRHYAQRPSVAGTGALKGLVGRLASHFAAADPDFLPDAFSAVVLNPTGPHPLKAALTKQARSAALDRMTAEAEALGLYDD